MDLLFKTIPAVALQLSGNSKFRNVSLILQLWYFAFSRKSKLCTRDFTLATSFNGNKIAFYLRYVMDIAVLREVFVEKEYEWCPIERPAVIIDLGAHFGDTTLYYAARFPEAKIIAVEPSPENFARLVKHTKNYSNIVPVQAAVGAVDGEIELYLMPSSLGHSIVEREGSSQVVMVQQFSLPSLLQKYEIKKADLIKFDIEGAEFELFKNIKATEYSNSYIGEIHYDLVLDKSTDFNSLFEGFEIEKTQLQNNNRFLIRIK